MALFPLEPKAWGEGGLMGFFYCEYSKLEMGVLLCACESVHNTLTVYYTMTTFPVPLFYSSWSRDQQGLDLQSRVPNLLKR